jgi:hypothetical protein
MTRFAWMAVLATMIIHSAMTPTSAAAQTKVCSPSNDPGWTAIVPVPDTWQPLACKAYAASVRANRWQLGCLFSTGPVQYSWGEILTVPGTDPPSIPNPNCGW